jgi:hypothetical protein
MITAIVLLCAIDDTAVCFYSVYPTMLPTEEECFALITQYEAEDRFTADVDGHTFKLSDYMCINWKNKRI